MSRPPTPGTRNAAGPEQDAEAIANRGLVTDPLPQRRYEAVRCYFLDGLPAEQVGARFGYSAATVHQLAAELRAGRTVQQRQLRRGVVIPQRLRAR